MYCPFRHCGCLMQTSCPHCQWVTPRFFCSYAYVSPLSGLSGCPSGNQFLFPPSTRVGPAVASHRSAPLSRRCRRRLRFASLRSVVRGCCRFGPLFGRSRLSTAESRRGSLDAPRRVSTAAVAAASRPPSKRSSSLFFLVCFCWFWCIIRCRFLQTVNSRRRFWRFYLCASKAPCGSCLRPHRCW